MSMICNNATQHCIGHGCDRAYPHVCAKRHPAEKDIVVCELAGAYVRCIPIRKPRSYDAEGRAARLEAIVILRRTRTDKHSFGYSAGLRDAYKHILRAMRDARKGAKNG
jgi:hypothetical protein